MHDTIDFIDRANQSLSALTKLSEIQYEYNLRKLVYQHDKIKLYHYQPKTKNSHSLPVLVAFATVNRSEILDLFPDKSFVGGLLENGMDVYLIDWGFPSEDDKDITFSDYVMHYLHGCVDYITQERALPQINLLGICQGGVMSLCYAAQRKTIKNLILISTPIDFHTEDNKVSQLIKHIDVDVMRQMTGNILGAWLTQFFISLRPFELMGKKYLDLMDKVDDSAWRYKFLRVEKWLHDAPDQAGAAFAEFINEFYHANKLIKHEIKIAGQPVNLSDLQLPILNVIASEDDIVPPSATRVLREYVSSTDYTEVCFPSGHIGIYISDKVGKRMSKVIADWTKKHDKSVV
ncbi:MAG: hypothetical protein A3F14_02965 [Gammaproteobacteria bacterium RIFCSPHIGHO2_12_FULL_43_28]|nr:MAG: hypothetical protein A3F14_02965 [Gammaproteobacteria bacterium RIFCSPHIGHO2_12_FULL_43_28]